MPDTVKGAEVDAPTVRKGANKNDVLFVSDFNVDVSDDAVDDVVDDDDDNGADVDNDNVEDNVVDGSFS